MSETRKLVAILVADVVGYSRLAGADEERTLARRRTLRSDVIDPTIAIHHGRVIKRTGDSVIGPNALTRETWSDARTASTTAPTSPVRSGLATTPWPRQAKPRVDDVGS